MNEEAQEAQPAPETPPAERVPPGSGVDPDVWVQLPAPHLLGVIDGWLMMLGKIERNERATISLRPVGADVDVCSASIDFPRVPPDMDAGVFFVKLMERMCLKLFETVVKQQSAKLATPSKALVSADGKVLTK